MPTYDVDYFIKKFEAIPAGAKRKVAAASTSPEIAKLRCTLTT